MGIMRGNFRGPGGAPTATIGSSVATKSFDNSYSMHCSLMGLENSSFLFHRRPKRINRPYEYGPNCKFIHKHYVNSQAESLGCGY